MNNLNLGIEIPLLMAILVLLFFTYMSTKNNTFKFICYAILFVAILLILFSCSAPRYCQPSKGSRDYARVTRILHETGSNLVYVRAKLYRNQWQTFYECLPDSITLGSFVSVNGWQKI